MTDLVENDSRTLFDSTFIMNQQLSQLASTAQRTIVAMMMPSNIFLCIRCCASLPAKTALSYFLCFQRRSEAKLKTGNAVHLLACHWLMIIRVFFSGMLFLPKQVWQCWNLLFILPKFIQVSLKNRVIQLFVWHRKSALCFNAARKEKAKILFPRFTTEWE